MLEAFLKHIKTENLINKRCKALLAVSGGVDSVVMVHLFHQAKLSFEILHCNFRLRGKDSGDDELFVVDLGKKYGVKVTVQHFDTKAFKEKARISIQMAARDLRYKWFEKYRKKNNAGLVAIAHHKDDAIETFFINLLRGTGIKGLTGYRYNNGIILRPLLFAHKQEILNYANSENLKFREDKSNQEDIYTRNYIRNNIVPMFQKLNPNFGETMQGNMRNLEEVEQLMKLYFASLKEELLVKEKNIEKLNIAKLKQLHPLKSSLFYLLQGCNFNSSVIDGLARSLDGEPGKIFYSRTHRIVKDREWLIIEKLKAAESEKEKTSFLDKVQNKISKPLNLSLRTQKREGLSIPTSNKMACLDELQLKFPLKVRPWMQGDFVYPLGMKHKKKLSDIFIDLKIPLNEKENIFVLESDGKIAWVIGYRIDDRFKTTEKTENVCLIEWLNGE